MFLCLFVFCGHFAQQHFAQQHTLEKRRVILQVKKIPFQASGCQAKMVHWLELDWNLEDAGSWWFGASRSLSACPTLQDWCEDFGMGQTKALSHLGMGKAGHKCLNNERCHDIMNWLTWRKKYRLCLTVMCLHDVGISFGWSILTSMLPWRLTSFIYGESPEGINSIAIAQ